MMDASDWAAWYAAGVSTVTAGWEFYKHLTKGPKLDVFILSYFNVPSAEQLFAGIDVINRGDAPATLMDFAVIDPKSNRYRLIIADPWAGEGMPEMPPHSRRQFGLVLVGEPARDASTKVGLAPILLITTSYSRDPIRIPISENWAKISEQSEVSTAKNVAARREWNEGSRQGGPET